MAIYDREMDDHAGVKVLGLGGPFPACGLLFPLDERYRPTDYEKATHDAVVLEPRAEPLFGFSVKDFRGRVIV